MPDSERLERIVKVDYPKWDPTQGEKSLWEWHDVTVKKAENAIEWYSKNKEPLRQSSRIFRGLAIFFTSVGTLIPLLSATGFWEWLRGLAGLAAQGSAQATNNALGQWGYVFFALAGVCIGFDKFFGYSSGWMRNIKTQLALEAALTELRYSWTIGMAKLTSPKLLSEQLEPMLQLLKDFTAKVNALVQQETETWVLEFQSSMAELDKAAKAQAEANKPGSIIVAVTKDAGYDPGITAYLDGVEAKKLEGSKCLFRLVSVGMHFVRKSVV